MCATIFWRAVNSHPLLKTASNYLYFFKMLPPYATFGIKTEGIATISQVTSDASNSPKKEGKN